MRCKTVRKRFSALPEAGSVMDFESVPKDVWQKAEERGVLRPLAALDQAPTHLVRVAAIDLQISERWAELCWNLGDAG